MSAPAAGRADVAARPLALWSAAAVVIVVAVTDPLVRALVLLAALDVAVTLARPGSRLRPLLLAAAVAGALAVAIDLLLSHTGDHVIASLPASMPGVGGPLTAESLAYGGATALGIAAAVLAVAPLALALEPQDLVGALPRPLERTAVAVGTAVALVPGVAHSVTAVRDAQRMRGWRPGGPRSWSEVLVPVAVTAIEDSVRRAEAMEARGFGSGRRTRYPAPVRSAASAAVAVTAVLAAAVVMVRAHAGVADWYPYPDLSWPPADPVVVAACLLLATPALVWRRSS